MKVKLDVATILAVGMGAGAEVEVGAAQMFVSVYARAA